MIRKASRELLTKRLAIAHCYESRQFQVSALDGMPNKLMVYYLTGDLPDETSRRTDVYSVPGFNLEHTYQQTVFRVKLEISGDKYHAYDYDYLTSDITIFNNDHTLWKTIETSAQPGETIENVFITERKSMLTMH